MTRPPRGEITVKTVQDIARLARLRLTPEEARLYLGQLSKILEHMGELEALDTSQVEPTAGGGTAAGTLLREDEPRPFPHPETLLGAAPGREGPYFKVPKVVGQEIQP